MMQEIGDPDKHNHNLSALLTIVLYISRNYSSATGTSSATGKVIGTQGRYIPQKQLRLSTAARFWALFFAMAFSRKRAGCTVTTLYFLA